MMTATTTEFEKIQAAEQAKEDRRQRAWQMHQYEKQREQVTRAIKNAETILSVPDPVITSLSQISALTAQLPPDISTQGTRWIPDGFDLREMLILLVSAALTRLEAKR